MMSKIVILGAGLAGLSAAYHLKRDYRIFEKEQEIGGLCRSKHIDGFTFDYSGHLLHFQNREGFNFIKELLGNALIKHRRRAWIHFKNAYIPYPFQANLYYLHPDLSNECLQGMLKRKSLGTEKPINLSEWFIDKFGRGMVKHFFLPYNTKFWTVPLEEMDYAWAENLVPVPAVSEVLEGAWRGNKKSFGYNVNFWYPKQGGIGELVRGLSGKICNIHLSKEVQSINWRKKRIEFTDGEVVEYQELVSTLPLVELAGLLTDLPEAIIEAAKRLRYVSIYNLNMGIDKERISDKHWIYFPEKEIVFFRLGFPMNFSKDTAPAGKSSLYAEVSYSFNKMPDKKELKKKIIEDLYRVKILKPKDKILLTDENDIKYGYILPDHNHQASQKEILDFLNSIRILAIGRYGRWSYMSMEETMLEGKRAAYELNKGL